jgi:arylsulfatase A-like enzyme
LVLLALLTGTLFLTVCTKTEKQILDQPPLLLTDPQIITIDYSTPFNRFDYSYGSIRLGKGWNPFEKIPETDEQRFTAWAGGRESEIFFDRPPFAELDLIALCHPFNYEGAPEQEIRFYIDDLLVGSTVLERERRFIRIPLSLTDKHQGNIRLKMKYRYAKSPKELGLSEDIRILTVNFGLLAIVPRQIEDVQEYLNALSLDPGNKIIKLPSGSGFTVPLPPNSKINLKLSEVSSTHKNDIMGLYVLDSDGGKEELWKDRVPNASGVQKSVSTSSRIDRLLLFFHGNGGHSITHSLSVKLDDSFLRIANSEADSSLANRPNIFIYLIDTLRADSLIPYGSKRPISPFIDDFANDAVTYLNAHSTSSWTLPATVSILTGLHAYNHKMMRGDIKLTDQDIPTIPGHLAKEGYDTVGISQSFVAGPDFGIDKIFTDFIFNNQLNSVSLRSQEIRRHFLNWLIARESINKPIFGYFHTVDPHSPYSPAGSFTNFSGKTSASFPIEQAVPIKFINAGYSDDDQKIEHLRALYDDEVSFADTQFGIFLELLQYLNLYENSIIVLVSDHGEEFNDHRGFDHGRTLYEEMIRIPLIIKYPGSRWSGSRIREPVCILDIMPTILEYINADWNSLNLDGAALLSKASGQLKPDFPKQRPIFSELDVGPSPMDGPVNYNAMIMGSMKCIFNESGKDRNYREAPKWEVYNLSDDPRETRSMADTENTLKYRKAFEQWLSLKKEMESREAGLKTQIDEKARDQLRALGYIK